MSDDRLKIAVFVDFDNIEIGVKNTLNRTFDISAVLEAIKERGEIVTKIAYGDWKRAGDYGRQMGQHAIQMVQRNLTPGGDKNGADINLALDALEMAFTLDHINAFVIVGGDSDFITLVEKLKQYDRKVIVVGGRGFTSTILQKNCHEFIAYENLIRSSSGRKQGSTRSSRSTGDKPIRDAVPLVRRALKILTDREVSPQLGLLKSTLLQLDSTFSERDYGATTFRDFIEKLARTGVITLKQVDRSLLVELAGEDLPSEDESGDSRTALSESEVAAKQEEGVGAIRAAFDKAEQPLKWPLYVRGIKQFIKSVDGDFDERTYGFTGILDALRQCQKSGVLRLERNRQGVLRVYPGDAITPSAAVATLGRSEESVRAETDPDTAEEETLEAGATSDVQPPDDGTPPHTTEARAKAKKRATKKKTTKRTTKKAAKKKITKKATKKAGVKKTASKKTKKSPSAEEPARSEDGDDLGGDDVP